MDELEQKCYDLDAKVRLVEEERDIVMTENDELQEQINALRFLIESENRNMEHGHITKEEVLRLSEEVARMDAALLTLKENFRTVNDKMKELGAMKETIRAIAEETTCVKEDFLNLKNHLNIAAKIELQTNEKMYENRLHHLEKMLEEMRHREESFLHIAEETNILKDQVDSLRELSLSSLKCERSPYNFSAINTDKNLTLNEELLYNNDLNRPISLQLSYDSPVTEQPLAVAATPSPLKITGQVKLSLASTASMTKASEATQTEIVNDETKAKEYKFSCCSDVMARLWAQVFD